MRFCLSLAALALLVGCTATNVDHRTAEPVPASRILEVKATIPGSGKVAVYFKRDSGLPLVEGYPTLTIGGRPIARIGKGEVLKVYLKPGTYVFGVPTDLLDSDTYTLTVQVGDDNPTVYRIAFQHGGMRLQPSAGF
jgi:hypothetical protein